MSNFEIKIKFMILLIKLINLITFIDFNELSIHFLYIRLFDKQNKQLFSIINKFLNESNKNKNIIYPLKEK